MNENIGCTNALMKQRSTLYKKIMYSRFGHWIDNFLWAFTSPKRLKQYIKSIFIGNNQYISYAKSEFRRMKFNNPDAIILKYKKQIYPILKKVGKEGLSGGSAPYYASIISSTIKNLILFNVISPIYNTSGEWNDVSSMFDDTMYQNKLQSAIFKDGHDGRPYFLDAIIWKDEKGGTFTSGNVAGYGSSQYIKSFPFMPKKFVVDVVNDKKTNHYNIVDKKQIDEVFKYYDVKPLQITGKDKTKAKTKKKNDSKTVK